MKKFECLTLCVAAAVMFAGCGKDVRQEYPTEDLSGKAFLSLALTSNAPAPVRANEEKPGTENESKADKVTVLVFDEMNKCLDAVDFSGAVIGNSDGAGNTAAASDPKTVPASTAKIFVVVNPYFAAPAGWDLSAATVKGKTWKEINTAMTNAVISNIATDGNFMMTSAGNAVSGALTSVTVFKPASYDDQSAIDAAKSQAKASAVEVKIDRLAAKVTVSANDAGVAVTPAGAAFEFTGWELNVVNRSVRLYSDLVDYANASPGAVYRRDNNYLLAEQPAAADMKDAFTYLSNINSSTEDMPVIARAAASSAYCMENTMDADAQKLGYTTKAVVKAKYSPAGFTLGNSYFFWNGEFYTLAQLKAAYIAHADGTGLKVDLPIFLNKAGLMEDDVFNGGDQNAKNQIVAGLADANFNAKTGIIARYCALRYYHESVCYYDVLIRHDQGVSDHMALGKYGVVRNNWYGLQVNSVSNPGTPWIPDPSDPDPSNPTKPDTDDDEGNAYMSVTITINPWTYWTQGVDLN